MAVEVLQKSEVRSRVSAEEEAEIDALIEKINASIREHGDTEGPVVVPMETMSPWLEEELNRRLSSAGWDVSMASGEWYLR